MTLVTVALARPGYDYQNPGAPSQAAGGSGGQFDGQAGGSGGQFEGQAGGYSPSGQLNSYENSGSAAGNGNSGGSENYDIDVRQGGDDYRSDSGAAGGGDFTQAKSQSFDASSGDEPGVSKHFYVYEAPEDKPTGEVQEKIINVRPQVHYKIIFIKAPSADGGLGGAGGAALAQVRSQSHSSVA